MTTLQDDSAHPTIVVIGAGIAGMSAAVSAAEAAVAAQRPARVIVIDRASRHEAGGLTKWTSAYLRLDDIYEAGDQFVPDVLAFSDGHTPQWYVEHLAEALPDTMEWIQHHGVRFKRLPTYFINSARKRLQPVGGGEGLLNALLPAAQRLGVDIRYDTTAHRLVADAEGTITGIEITSPHGVQTLCADAVIIASGGFEGDPDATAAALGSEQPLIAIAPGVAFNRGEGIHMALERGAAKAGQWSGFHAEPVDPRSDAPEPLVMVFPYGILVNTLGLRFMDEGAGTVDETYESTARTIWRQPQGRAYFITDRQHERIDAWERGLLTTVKPITADTVQDLANALLVPAETLARTIADFNAATVDEGAYDWKRPDGTATSGLVPPKSNWALPLANPPYLAYPIECAIVFTFGGLATDQEARVLDEQQQPIAGLYAAGECTGIYHGKYPGGTSVLRGMIYGRIAGRTAATRVSVPAAD